MSRLHIMSVCLEPKVRRALDHYIRAAAVAGEEIPGRFSKSAAINGLLHRGLRRAGFDPDNLRLIGEGRS